MNTLRIAIGLSVCLAGCIVGDGINDNSEDIIGGVKDPGDPSVVVVFAHQPGQTSGSLCTGSVISPTAVLTAAHCVDPAVVGAGNVFEIYTGMVAGQTPPLAVASTVYDTAFDVNNLQNGHDVAIVKLAQPTALAPLPLGSPSGTSIRIVGYGMSTHIVSPYIDSGVGTKRTATTRLTSVDSKFLEIGSTSHQTCHGDSGGPAFQNIGGQDVIVGVTSFGTDLSGQVVCIQGGTDTRVDQYLSFINANK